MSGNCTPPSRYLAFLPGIFQDGDNDFLGRFLCIFEHLLMPVESTIDEIAAYFDSPLAPEEFLPWLANWIGLVIDERWSLETQRILIQRGVEFFRWRGTAHGLQQLLELYVGDGSIVEINDQITDSPFEFTVTLLAPGGANIDEAGIKAIIEANKPAHTHCRSLDIENAAISSESKAEGGLKNDE